MATIRQFKAIRPTADKAREIAALPYDVMDEAEARQTAEGNPLSFLHVDRAEVDFPLGTDPYSAEVYEKAAENLESMVKNGLLIQDGSPCLYLYRLTMDGHSQTGLVACVPIDEYINGVIKRHELTRAEKEEDRIKHVDACDANTGPIFLSYKDNGSIKDITESWISSHEPAYDFRCWDKVSHTLWVIDDKDTIENLVELFKEVPCLYIADGHHRAASAVKVGLKRREENPGYNGSEEFNYFLSIIFPQSELKIMEYNRLVKDLNGLSENEFIEKVTEKFFIMPYNFGKSFKPIMPHQFGMYFGGKWYILTADPENIPDDTVGALDVSILQNNLLSPILGIGDPRTDSRIDFCGGVRGIEELERRVDLGEMKIAFSMFPTSMEELTEIADKGLIMPPKSTWFEPKLRSGLLIHSLKG